MLKHIRRGEQGQIAVLLAVAMIGLLAMVALAIDGGMLFWNQRRAQNGADAAAIAGVSELADAVYGDCATSSEQPILDAVYEYASNNEVPDADSGENVAAYYLTQDASGDYVDLLRTVTITHADSSTTTTVGPWEVGATGSIPCSEEPEGLRVVTQFPQPTFMAGVIGIAETNVTVDASAVHEYNDWCTGFAIVALSESCSFHVLGVTGSDITINGGMHSNGGMQIGGGGQGIYLQDGRPVDHGETCNPQIGYDKIIGGPEPDEPDKGIDGGEYFNLNVTNIGYEWEDFITGGWVFGKTPPADYHYFDRDIRTNDVQDPSTGELIDGLYVTTGDIKLNRLTNAGEDEIPWNVTFVALGTVEISGGFTQWPYSQNIFILSFSDDLASSAVNLAGDANEWAGLILAPSGLVSVSGAKNSDLAGMIVGYEVDASGSNMSITQEMAFCPANPIKILLVE